MSYRRGTSEVPTLPALLTPGRIKSAFKGTSYRATRFVPEFSNLVTPRKVYKAPLASDRRLAGLFSFVRLKQLHLHCGILCSRLRSNTQSPLDNRLETCH